MIRVPSERAKLAAEAAVNRASVALHHEAVPHRSREPSELPPDVGEHTFQFEVQLHFCARFNVPFPCLETQKKDLLPIHFLDASAAIADADATVSKLAPLSLQATLLMSRSGRVVRAQPPAILGAFKKRLEQFLSARFEREPPGGPADSPVDMSFSVTTVTSGLKVYASPAYFLTQRQVFGYPSSPVEGRLMPGRYCFGVSALDGTGLCFSEQDYVVPGRAKAELGF